MNAILAKGVEAWPVSREGPSHQRILQEVIIRSDHPTGSEVIHLSPDQALYVHSRLSHIATAFLHGHPEYVHNLGVEALPPDHEHQMSRCGAKVWPVSHASDGLLPELSEVVIEREYMNGSTAVHLTPEQARIVHDRLTQISMAFLHENIWGGEDGRAQ